MYEIQNAERLNVPAVSRAKLEYALNEALKKILCTARIHRAVSLRGQPR